MPSKLPPIGGSDEELSKKNKMESIGQIMAKNF